MKHLVLFCFVLFCFVLKTKSQNLVPNPSFEINSDCSSARLDNAIGWNSTCNGAGICTYYLNCQTDPFYTSPYQYLDNCFKSYQYARTGQAYTLFGVYIQNATNQESNHPSIKLIDTLEAGKIYCVTYYVSVFNNAVYTIDKLGALFTPTPFPYYITGTTTPTVGIVGQYTPQVVTPPNIAIGDTLNWIEVSNSFNANGNETYITLGDFFYHNQHLINNAYPSNCNAVALYYVDDVSVEEVEIAKAKNDTLIYQGDSVLIGANNSEAALFSWQPTAGLSCTNCPNPKASPTVNTTYTVTKTQCKSTTTDEITVSVSPVGINELNSINAITLQPNPTNGVINITSRFEMQRVEIINVAGQILLSVLTKDKSQQLNLADFSAGIYFIKIVLVNGMTVTKKILKQ